LDTRPKILVVDDSEFIVELIDRTLSDCGYIISKAYDGEEALHKIAVDEPDLIILDVMMPKMTGLEVCRKLKSDKKTMLIPVVLLTAKNFVEDKVTGFETGADDYITKPFNTKELKARIQGLINKKISQVKVVEVEKQEALETLAEEVAHEIRNPVTAIGGFARRIMNKLPEGSQLREYAQMIINEAERLETMVGEIAEFKDIVVSANELVDIQEIVDSVLEQFNDEMSRRNIEKVLQYDSEVSYTMGDEKNLKLVFTHVVENAVESIDGVGTITIKIGEVDDYLIIDVIDTGRGISVDELKRITRPFYTSKMSGAGMGLVIVKYIIEAHGGGLNISSVSGVGTTVRISIPVDRKK
jgi:signal transduction histidine kinase